mgnify:CR=1 FL=1
MGLEIDICSDGIHPALLGLGIFYGAQTDTMSDGPETMGKTGLDISPFRPGRNGLLRGIAVEGKIVEGALQAGCEPKSEVAHIFDAGPGCKMKFRSGTGNGERTTWHSLDREFSVTEFPVVGLIDVEVDGTTLQIPVRALGGYGQGTLKVTVNGLDLPAGALVTLCIGAANRDPAVYENPEQLDLRRTGNKHLAFGFGVHQCAGLSLARLEGRIAIGRFLRRFPEYRLSSDPERGGRARFRGFLSAPFSTH